MKVIKNQLESEGLLEITDFYTNGKEALEGVSKTIEETESSVSCPVPLMLVDQQMPIMNGITFVEKFRYFLQMYNQTKFVQIESPLIVFLTAYNSVGLRAHLKTMKIEHVYDKPLTQEQLREIISLI